jgi:cytochrome c-type biogenesis protein CcmH/NrfG
MGRVYGEGAISIAKTPQQQQQCWAQAAQALERAKGYDHDNTEIMMMIAHAHEHSGNLAQAGFYYDLTVKAGDDRAQGNALRVAEKLASLRPQGSASKLFAAGGTSTYTRHG